MALGEIGLSLQQMGGDARLQVGRGGGSYPLTGPLPERICRLVNTRFDMAREAARGRFNQFHRYDRIIKMISKRKSVDWKANAYLPYAIQAVEQGAAMKFLKMMRRRPYVMVQPRRAAPQEVANHREGLLDWHFTGDVDLVDILSDTLRSCERYGKAIAMVVPDWDDRSMRFRGTSILPTVYGPMARLQWKTAQDRAYRVRVEPQDLICCFPQPGFRRINGYGGMHWFIRQYWKTYDELEEMEAKGQWGAAVGGQPVAMLRDSQDVSTDEFLLRRMLLSRQDSLGIDKDQFDRSVHILEYHGRVPQECMDPVLAQAESAAFLDPKHRVMTVANGKVVGSNQAFPWDHGFKPFVEMDCIPDQHDFWGTGKIELSEHLIYVGNEIMNMRIDNVKAAINGLIGVDGTRMPPGWKRKLISQPFGVHETNGTPQEIIQRLQLGDVTASSYTEQQQLYTLIQEATSQNETTLGAPGGAVRTLGEHQIKSEMSSRRSDFELSGQSKQLFSATREKPGLVHFILMLDRQYMPLPQYINLVRPGMPDTMAQLQIAPADLALDLEDFAYLPAGAVEVTESQAARAETLQFLSAFQPYIEIAIAGGMDIMDLLKQAMRGFNLDVSRLFPRFPTGPMQALQQGMQPGMGAAGGPPGAGGGGGEPGQGGSGGVVAPFRGRGMQGGSLRPEQRAAPGNRPTPPWEGGSASGGRYGAGARPSQR